MLPTDYEGLTSMFLRINELGIYSVYGDDEGSDDLINLACAVSEEPLVCLGNWFAQLIDFDSWGAQTQSIGAFLYYAQLLVEGRFQEPQSLIKYAQGERVTPLVPIWNIDRVPVSIVHAIDDHRCGMAFAEEIYN